MAHGAIVVRDYGLPAVVRVAGAAARIHTGQQITIDGSQGTITFAPWTVWTGTRSSESEARAGNVTPGRDVVE